MLNPPTVTDYRGHRRTLFRLFPVREINLKAYADAILTQITWLALEFDGQPAKPSAYRAKPWGQGIKELCIT